MSTLSWTKIRQRFDLMRVNELEGAVRSELEKVRSVFPPGKAVAIAVGSRGIANISQIVRASVNFVRSAGSRPFIVPAMGSHGGATADGQTALLASFGVTEEAMGCPIRSSMEVITLPNNGLPNGLFMDRHAWESDGVLLINRIKPHTDFHGRFESGLAKMAVIGLGKERQASELHRFGVFGLRDLMPASAERVLATGKILAGLAVIENALDETAKIEALPASLLLSREPELLEIARAHLPRLPISDLDVLIVDRLGKNISGTGMDTNVIGRIRITGEPEPASPRIRSIMVTDLSAESHGNATGIGLADVVTRRLFEKINFPVTYKNIVTSGFLERGKLPVVAETARQALEIALRGAGCLDESRARIARIEDTLHLGRLYVSAAVREEIEKAPKLDTEGEVHDLFDATGELCDF